MAPVVAMMLHMDQQRTAIPVLVGADELRSVIGVGVQTIHRLRRLGRIPSYRIGGQYRFNVDEVLAALRDQPDEPEAA